MSIESMVLEPMTSEDGDHWTLELEAQRDGSVQVRVGLTHRNGGSSTTCRYIKHGQIPSVIRWLQSVPEPRPTISRATADPHLLAVYDAAMAWREGGCFDQGRFEHLVESIDAVEVTP